MMKHARHVLALGLAAAVFLAVFPMTAFAATWNWTSNWSATTVNSGDTVTVSGAVTFDGQPTNQAIVGIKHMADDVITSMYLNADGTYSLSFVPAFSSSQYEVYVNGPNFLERRYQPITVLTPTVEPTVTTATVTAAYSTNRVICGSTAVVSGTVKTLGGVAVTTGAVSVYKSGSTTALGTATITDGTYAITFTPTTTSGYYYTKFTATNHTANQTADYYIKTLPRLSAVSGKSTIYRYKTYSYYGYVNPRTATSLKVYKWNSSLRKYVGYKTITASVGTTKYSAGYKATAKWRPSARGTYRVKFYSGGNYGAYKKVVVK